MDGWMDWILLRSQVLLEHLAVLTKSASQNHPQVKNWNHICQNVPVDTARYWAAQVLDFCNGDLEDSGANFVKQDNIKQDVVLKDSFLRYNTLSLSLHSYGNYISDKTISNKKSTLRHTLGSLPKNFR